MNHEAHEEHEGMRDQSQIVFDNISRSVVDCAFYVHNKLGPGLLESAYEECLCIKLAERDIPFARQKAMPFDFDGHRIDIGYKLDLVIDNDLILELKSVEKLLPIHEAQLLTYMKLSGIRAGLLINFNARLFRDGIKRLVI